MGWDSIEETRKFFNVSFIHSCTKANHINSAHKELESKVSISTDGWMSSNQHAFLAIVIHYVTNNWELGKTICIVCYHDKVTLACKMFLEEMLLNFRELTSEHLGENMSNVIWDTLETYRIEDQVYATSCILDYGWADI